MRLHHALKLSITCVILVSAMILIQPIEPSAEDAKNLRYLTPEQLSTMAPMRNVGAPDSESETAALRRSFGNYVRASAAASPGTSVGTTFFDYQHNGSAGRQVGTYKDTIMVSFMQTTSGALTPRDVVWNRVVVVNSVQSVTLDNGDNLDILPLGTPLHSNGVKIDADLTGAGYTNLEVFPNSGESIVLAHQGGLPRIQVDSLRTGTFYNAVGLNVPPPADEALAEPIWPKGAVSIAGTGGPDTIFHVVARSSLGQLYEEIFYWRGTYGRNGWIPTVSWESPLELDTISTISHVVAADPNSPKVAIVYTRPLNRLLAGQEAQTLCNVVYWESSDDGANWTGPTFITNQTGSSSGYWAYADVDALYDDNSDLHVVYTTVDYVGPGSGPFALDLAGVKVWHWDASSSTSTIVAEANWMNTCATDGFGTGRWNRTLAKPSIAFKPALAGPGSGIGSAVLYTIWTQFGPTQTDCSTAGAGAEFTNGEIYMSASSNGGASWGTPRNVTGTETPNCAAGGCLSENWVTAAARADSGLYLSYVEDTHPGGAPVNEGFFTESPYKVLAVASYLPQPTGRMAPAPLDPLTWLDPFWSNIVIDNSGDTPSGDPVSAQIYVANIGNGTLDYTATVMPDVNGPSYVTVNSGASYNGSIAEFGAPEVITIDIIPMGYSGVADFRVQLTNNAASLARVNSAQLMDTVDLIFRIPGLEAATCPIVLTGDGDISGSLTSADIILLVNFAFKSGAPPQPCEAAGDVNCNGSVTSADVIQLVNHVFKGGPAPCDVCTIVPGTWACP